MAHRFTDAFKHYLGLEPVSGVDSASDPLAEAAHRAVLELLVATMFADGTVSDTELTEIHHFDDHRQWDTPTFSFTQSFGEAVARVRAAREAEGGIDALLADAAAQITDPALAATIAEACRMVATADGAVDDPESAWLAAVERTFGG